MLTSGRAWATTILITATLIPQIALCISHSDSSLADTNVEPVEFSMLPDPHGVGLKRVDTFRTLPMYGVSLSVLKASTRIDLRRLLAAHLRDGFIEKTTKIFVAYRSMKPVHLQPEEQLYLVNIHLFDCNDPVQWVLIYSTQAGEATKKFEWIGSFRSYFATIKTIDIDGDSTSEVIIEYNLGGTGESERRVQLVKYSAGEVSVVFQAGLTHAGLTQPRSFENSYSFWASQLHPGSLDIIFSISTDVDVLYSDPEVQPYLRAYGLEGFKPVRQTIRYVFNGAKYLPDRKPFDYEKWFQEYRRH